MFRSQKSPSAGIMRFWKTKSPSPNQALDAIEKEQPPAFIPGYLRLEQRTLLSATFATVGGTELVLNDFDTGQDLDFSQANAIVNGISQDSFVFQVASGSFTGNTANPLIELENVNGGINNQLEIATAFFQGAAANAELNFDGLSTAGTAVEFTQSSNNLTFDSLQLSNFTNDNRDFELIVTGDVTLNNVTVFDSDPTDAVTAPATLEVSVVGNLNLTGQTGNLISNPNANVDLSASGNVSMAGSAELTSQQTIEISSTNGSVTLSNASAGADIQVQAANNVTQRSGTEIDAGTTVNFIANNGSVNLASLTTGEDVQAQAFNNIVQQSGSDVIAGTTVNLTANNGTVNLGNVSAGADIQIQAASNLTQQSTTEVVAGATINFTSDNGSVNLADVTTTTDIQFQAFNNITQQFGSDVIAGTTVNLSAENGFANLGNLSAGEDIQIQAASDITQQVASTIDANTTVNLIANNGAVTLADVSANDNIQVQAQNDITQQAGTEVDAGATVNFITDNGSVDLTDVSAGDEVLVQAEGDITQQTNTQVDAGSNVNFVSNNGSATLADISAGTSIQVQATNNIAQLSGTEIDAGTTANFIADNGTIDLTNVSAGVSVLVQAANDVTQQSSTTVNAGSTINIVSSDGSITLTDVSGNNIQVQAANDITQLAGTEVNAAGAVSLIANNGAITLANISTDDDLQIQANNDITQQASSAIVVGASATASSTSGDILLATTSDQTITVVDQANFAAGQIEIGLDGTPAGSVTATNVLLGSVSLNASTAILVEDDATTLAGNSDVDNLFASSSQGINNIADAALLSNNAQLNAVNDIVLGNQSGDSFLLNEVSLITENVHLEVDGDLVINGVQPTVTNTQPIATGTQIDQSLYVIADGSVEQTQGDLHAQQIGIEATDHVHLTSIAAVNNAIAITAGGSQLLTDPTLVATLDSLAAVENGEVDATRPQAIALAHRGDVNVTNVSSITGSDSLTGFNSTDGSISVFADQTISLQQDIAAFSPIADPQVTLYSATGDATNPGVFFVGGEASVIGPTNIGVVNSNQAFANFLDVDGFLFDETTQLLILNTDGTVSQDIVIEYGQLGEVGFRVGIVFDALNQPTNPVEALNLFTPSNTVDSEAFEDTLFQQNTVIRALIGGNEGGRETFSQIDDFTAQAVIDHFDNPDVFTDIIVRNDQDINLFTGPLATVDNSLNETTQRILSVFDLPRGAAPLLPTITPINSIEVRPTFDLPFDSPPPIDQTSSIFSRQIAPFEEGELRWVQVEIPVDELEVTGDEVSLRQPSRLYPAAEDAAEHTFQNVGENETDRIISQIERSPDAEPGDWHRIFKAYDYRDDELFFYYYKTGEVDDAASDLEAGDQSPNDSKSPRNNESFNEEGFDERAPSFDGKTSLNDISNYPTTESATMTVKNSATDDDLLISLLRRESGPTDTATTLPPAADVPTVDQAVFVENYDHLSRLKRKLKRCL